MTADYLGHLQKGHQILFLFVSLILKFAFKWEEREEHESRSI